ncbi:TatD family hydrolase [bacterium]|nr:TatD family hydrolase [bacterium]
MDAKPLADDLDGVLARAREAGVSDIVAPAYDPESWEAVAALAAAHPGVHPALGLHPWVADRDLDFDDLRARLLACGAVAVGEIGLDAKIDGPGMGRQVEILRPQLHLARELDLPVILHDRGAAEHLVPLLREVYGSAPVRGVVHAFSRGPELARRYLDLGLHLGFGGAVTRTDARARRAAAAAPPERIVLETDAPSIVLQDVPAGACEPRHVREVCLALAELRGLTADAAAALTTENARELFRLP